MAYKFRTPFAETTFFNKYSQPGAETWPELCKVLVNRVCGKYLPKNDCDQLTRYMTDMKFLPGGRYLYYANKKLPAFNNCFLLKAESDTREDWADLSYKAESCLMLGGGIGVDYSIYREKGRQLSRTGGVSSGPLPKMQMVDAIGTHVMQGGSRRSAMYASLNYKHGDIEDFLVAKNWHDMSVGYRDLTLFDLKKRDFNFKCPLDMTNISVNYDTEWADNFARTGEVGSVFKKNCLQALSTGEPGFSFNFYEKENETLRNA